MLAMSDATRSSNRRIADRIWMSPEATAKTMSRWHWLTLLGFALLVCGVCERHCLGCPSGLTLLMFGIFAGTFRVLYREKGIWMLSALCLIVYIPFYAMLEYELWRMQHNPKQGAILFSLQVFDSVVSAVVALELVRFLGSITRVNWQLSRKNGTRPMKE
jgi:hypothetical protein